MAVAPDGPSIAAASRAWFHASIDEFISTTAESIVGQLVAFNTFQTILQTQTRAWRAEIEFLHSRLAGLSGWILFEFSIPRMGRRIDVVLPAGTGSDPSRIEGVSTMRRGIESKPMMRRPVVHTHPDIMGGEPIFVGTRVPVRSLFDCLEAGDSLDKFLRSFPSVTKEQAIAALEIGKEAV